MTKYVKYDDARFDDATQEMLKTEMHHGHKIVEVDGKFCWEVNDEVNNWIEKRNICLNDVCPMLHLLGYGKNSEIHRKLFRDIGYPLFGYWEKFYWEVNNKDVDDYVPPATLTTDGAEQGFEREARYTVLKDSDVCEALEPDEKTDLIFLCDKVKAYRDAEGKKPLECLVVESDWPEYEPTWKAIEQRVKENTNA